MLSQMKNNEWTAVDNYHVGAQAVASRKRDRHPPRVSVTTIQTVGGKGYDGFAVALVISD